jgi:hypothetical protein
MSFLLLAGFVLAMLLVFALGAGLIPRNPL